MKQVIEQKKARKVQRKAAAAAKEAEGKRDEQDETRGDADERMAADGGGDDGDRHGQHAALEEDLVAGAGAGTEGNESDELYEDPPPEDDGTAMHNSTDVIAATSITQGSWPSDRSWLLAFLIGVFIRQTALIAFYGVPWYSGSVSIVLSILLLGLTASSSRVVCRVP